MSEEVEEIIDVIKSQIAVKKEWLAPLGLDRETWKKLLGYITDLQYACDTLWEENKNLTSILTELEEWLKKRIKDIEEEIKDFEEDIPLSN